jgi:cell division protein FtsW (lipid II flippase)
MNVQKSYRKSILIVLLAVIGLAGLGLLFCWVSPVGAWLFPETPHAFFARQAAAVGMGAAIASLMALAGWRRCLAAGPWLMLAWLAMLVAAWCQPAVNGAHNWLTVGSLHVEVWSLFPIAFSLAAAWLLSREKVANLFKPTHEDTRSPHAVVPVLVACVAVVVMVLAMNVNRQESVRTSPRTEAVADAEAQSSVERAQSQFRAAFADTDWFAGKKVDLRHFPCAMTDGAISASALVLGKWFPATVFALLCVLGVGLALMARWTTDAAKRTFVVVAGVLVLVPAVNSFLVCLGVAPLFLTPVPLVSYGGMLAVGTLSLVGVLFAMAKEERGA